MAGDGDMSEETKVPMTAKTHAEIKNRVPRMAICYDFDKTLSPDDMQTFTLIPSFGIDKAKFWSESDKLARDNLMDKNLAWMLQLIRYSNFLGKSLRKEYFRESGQAVKLFPGVDTWFTRMIDYAAERGLELEHYIISSGLKEIIEGSTIAPYIKRVYASSYYYSHDSIAMWPAQVVNYTSKTQYIFRVAKGYLEEYDERVNDQTPIDDLRIPYENIVYIGDSATDIPCMRLVEERGGHAIGVFDPVIRNLSKVYELYMNNRISFYAPADYSEGGDLTRYLKQTIDEISFRERMRKEKMMLEEQQIEIIT